MSFKLPLLLTFAAAFAAGCSNSSNSENKVNGLEIPDGVTAAFTAEHPNAKINDPREKDRNDDKTYIIPYTLSDGTKGLAVYSSQGVLLDGN
jgi:hypothetical protein